MHRLKGKEAALKSKCRGEMGPAPGKIMPSSLLWGAKKAKQELGPGLPKPGPPPGAVVSKSGMR